MEQTALCPIYIDSLNVIRGTKEIYRNFSVTFAAGSVTALLAPSGAGKTTLLDCIAGLCAPQSGSIRFGSAEKELHRVSYLFQSPRLLSWCTLLKNCMLPLENIMTLDEASFEAKSFLKEAGLLNRCNDFPGQLSGGERQRCALARAFAYPAPVLLMDEAFQSQDIGLKQQLMDLLSTMLRKKARTTILVTHDIREALALADRVIVLAPSEDSSVLEIKLDAQTDSVPPVELRDSILQILASASASI